jgi:AcrR family transcriptional regulator
MGLRASKSARTREQILAIALDLFVTQGYEQTTIEQIAERAEVGITTLYRYYAGKDALLLEPFTRSFDFARLLRQRPESEPLGVALARVISESFAEPALDHERFDELRAIVERTDLPRGRLYDLTQRATRNLEEAIGERLGSPSGSLTARLSAGVFFSVWMIAAERWGASDDRNARDEIVAQLLSELHPEHVIWPGDATA